MAENGRLPSLSPNSENDSSEHSPRSFTTLSGGSSVIGGGANRGYINLSNNNNNNNNYKLIPTAPPQPQPTKQLTPPPPSAVNGGGEEDMNTPNTAKRPRGRPLGSKNKLKPPIYIREENEQLLKPVVIEIPAGNDVVEAIITFARRRRVCISVMSGSGLVSDVTFCHPSSRAPVFPIRGTFTLLSLRGTYIFGRFPSLSSTNNNPPCSSFGIQLCGNQGHVIGGVIGGKVMASSIVVVVASIFKNPEYHRVPFINLSGGEETEENNNRMYAGVINAAAAAVAVGDPNASNNNNNNNNNMAMSMAMSAFGVAATSSNPLNGQIPPSSAIDVDLIQWNHHAPSHQFN